MPFGVVNSPATFQGYINYVLRKYLGILCITYLDDILIYSVNSQTHTGNVLKVLQQHLKYGLYINLRSTFLE